MPAAKRRKTPSSCAECEKRGDGRARLMKLLADAVKKMEEKLTAEEFKPSLGDFLKLVQMEKELGQETAKEIKVTWVETAEESKLAK
jgi:hypothetical protein